MNSLQMGARSAEIFQIYQLIFLINSYQMGARSAEIFLIYQLIFLGRAQRGKFLNLCVDKIRSRPRGILCVDKIGSPEMLAFSRLFAHFLFQNQRMITSPIEK